MDVIKWETDVPQFLRCIEEHIIANILFRFERAKEELSIPDIQQLSENLSEDSTEENMILIANQINTIRNMKAYTDLLLVYHFELLDEQLQSLNNNFIKDRDQIKCISTEHIPEYIDTMKDIYQFIIKEKTNIEIIHSESKSTKTNKKVTTISFQLFSEENQQDGEVNTITMDKEIVDIEMMNEMKRITEYFDIVQFDKKLQNITSYIKLTDSIDLQQSFNQSNTIHQPIIIQQKISFKLLLEGGIITIQIDSVSYEIEIRKGMKLTKPIEKVINGKKYHIYCSLEEDTSPYHFTKKGNNLLCELSSIQGEYHDIILPTNERIPIHITSNERIIVIRNKGFPLSDNNKSNQQSSCQYERGLLIIRIV